MIVEGYQNIVVSEEDLLGLHLSPPIEKDFLDFSINRGNLPTRFGALVDVFFVLSSNVVIH